MLSFSNSQWAKVCCAVVLGGALMWSAESLRAQVVNGGSTGRFMNLPPRVPLTRDAAAKSFAALLEYVAANRYSGKEPDSTLWSSVSRSSETESLPVLLTKMAEQWKQPQEEVKVQSEDSNTSTVVLETPTVSRSRPLVLVKEGESWGVDVMETYAKWNGLEGAAKTQAIQDLTVAMTTERENARSASCMSNLKQIALGIAQYTQDYDEKLPPAKQWEDVLMPYTKSEQLFRCPSVASEIGHGYAYNSKASQKTYEAFPSPALTVSLYETTNLKHNSYGMGENTAYRHLESGNYAFMDGHVKRFRKSGSQPSFRLNPISEPGVWPG